MMDPNVQVCLLEGKPGEIIVAELLMAEMTFGAFHVGDILCIRNTNYRLLRREVTISTFSTTRQLSLYLFVEKVVG